jgi:response regulator RpfG family c-di-GMP phosphodiesterase
MNSIKPTILCIDDDPVVLKLLYDILAPSGFNLIATGNGKAALGIVGDKPVDVVLLDVIPPQIDGFEVCRLIKSNPRTRNIPIIIITAPGARDDRIHGINAGADEFLTKPFDKTEVLARINMLIKVKRLNDKVTYAYNNITRLTSFGEEIINNFDPLEFNFETVIDSLVQRIIKQAGDMTNNPAYVLVRTLDGENMYVWQHYEYVFDKMVKTTLDIDRGVKLPVLKDMNLFFYNHMEKTVFIPLVETLKNYKLNVQNLVCYVKRSLSIFCVNYGRNVSSFDAAVLNSLVLQALFLRSLSRQVKETSDAHEYSIHALARAAESHDDDTGNHIARIGLYCALLAKKLNMKERFVRDIHIQSQLHDVGKLDVPSSILRKTSKLTPEESAIMKTHTTCGAKIIGGHPRFRIARTIAMTHHEKWDGSGYPIGLSYENIPIEGRIAALADQYDALRNSRLDKPAFDHDTARGIILTGDGMTMPRHFDPKVLKAFTDISAVFDETYRKLENPRP